MRIAKIILGLLLVGYGIYSGNYWFYLGLIPLVTGMFNLCCMKKIIGTCSGDSCSSSETQSCCSDTSSTCCSGKEEDKSSTCCSGQEEDTSSACCSSQNKDANSESKTQGVDEILILGTGCPKCIALQKVVEEVATSFDGKLKVKKIEDVEKIMNYGVMSTPGLVINGEVRSTGKVLSHDEFRRLLESEEIMEEKTNNACCSSKKGA